MSDKLAPSNVLSSSSSLTSLNNGKIKHKAPSTMVSVVEEQSNDDDMVHILPLAASSNKGTTNSNIISEANSIHAAYEENSDKMDRLEKPSDVNQVKMLTASKDLKSTSVKMDKKTMDQLPATLTSINEIKLKKTTNPSISSLRAMSIQGNYPTTSSASTTMTKASTRAEYFAAKLHDAIKNDTKNQNDTVETFVYDTTAVNAATPSITEQECESTITSTKPLIQDLNSEVSPKNTFIPNEDSPCSHQTYDEYFDVKSKSSIGSKKQNKKKTLKVSGERSSFTDYKPFKSEKCNKTEADKSDKLENDSKSVNQLRQITSRLFDNKVLQQRRQSEVDNDFADDSFDEDLDFYEPSLSNITSNHENYISNYNYKKQMNQRNNSNSNGNNANAYEFGITSHDLEYGDEATDFFSSNYNSISNLNNSQNFKQNMNNSYLNKQPINGSLNYPDYGSIDCDKRKWRRPMYHNSPHDFTSVRAQRLRQIKSFCYSMSLIVLLLFIGFISGFILATNKELQGLKVVDTFNTLVSQEELVFDMSVTAFNPGLMSINIEIVQLDIFAKTQYIHNMNNDAYSELSYDTVLLGSIDVLEVPLFFQGGFLNRKRNTSQTQIKIVNPCSFDNPDDGNDNSRYPHNNTIDEIPIEMVKKPIVFTPDTRWLNISRHPFDLIVRGAMMYKLPFSSQNHTVSISHISYVDPGDD